MRVPIQVTSQGDLYITIDLELTPPGFEDALDGSTFKRRLLTNRSTGEFLSPDVSALVGNESAVLYRQRCVDESRACFIFCNDNTFHNRYMQLGIKTFGPMGRALQLAMSANPSDTHWLTFRLQKAEDEEGNEIITDIFAADYTPVNQARHTYNLN